LSANPETFLAGVVELFCQYPADIVQRAVSPVFGLPKKFKFPPRISDIAEFLEEEMAPIRRQQERNRLAEERTRALPAPIDRSKRKSYEELKVMCWEKGLKIGKETQNIKPLTPKEIDGFKEKFEITNEEWDAIPDGPLAPYKL
jgi:hypothetical protein